MVAQVVERGRAITEQHDITLDAPGALVGNIDGLRVEQVMRNLMDNAIKYSPSGGAG